MAGKLPRHEAKGFREGSSPKELACLGKACWKKEDLNKGSEV